MNTFKPFLLLCISAVPFGGKTQTPPVKIPDLDKPSYWVVETGPATTPYTVIRFYNEAHGKVYEHRTEGKSINASRPVVQRRLKKAMKRYSWNKSPEAYVLRTR